jgi:hypothetical protein
MQYTQLKAARATQFAVRRALFLTLIWSACAPPAQTATSRTSPSVIELSELESRSFPSVYDAIRSLRPSWLLGTVGGVYVDDVRMAGVDWLRQTSVAQVQRIEVLSADEATAKWGTRELSARFIHVRRRR